MKISKLMRVFLLLISLFVTGCIYIPSLSQDQSHVDLSRQDMQELVDKKGFIELFRHADKYGTKKHGANYIISDQVMQFIELCCDKDEDAVVSLFRSNGMKISNTVSCDRHKVNEQWVKIKPDCDEKKKYIDLAHNENSGYDEIYFAKDVVMIPTFLYSSWERGATLYIKDRKVVKVSAHVFLGGL